jgi:hypothetical protein
VTETILGAPRTGAARLLLAAFLVLAACGDTSSGVTVASVGRTGSSAPAASAADSSVTAATTADTVPSTAAPLATADVTKVEFTSPEGDFVVTFPGQPKSTDTSVPLPDGSKITVTSYAVEREDGAFIVAVADYPADLVGADPKVVLEGARDGALQNVQATLTTSESISLGAVPGIAFGGTVASNNGVLTTRIFLDGVRLYQVFAVGDAASSSLTADTAAFLDSFKLTKVGG